MTKVTEKENACSRLLCLEGSAHHSMAAAAWKSMIVIDHWHSGTDRTGSGACIIKLRTCLINAPPCKVPQKFLKCAPAEDQVFKHVSFDGIVLIQIMTIIWMKSQKWHKVICYHFICIKFKKMSTCVCWENVLCCLE